MHAALLFIPLAALAAFGLAAQDDPVMDEAMNAVDAAGAEADMVALNESEAFDMENMTDMNMTAEETGYSAWLSDGGAWLLAGEEMAGARWYFDVFDSDFSSVPYRVVLRTDETHDPGRAHNNTARTAELDCAGNRYRILATTHYDDDGRATEADERGDGSMRPIPPGTLAGIAETICSHAENGGSMITNAM